MTASYDSGGIRFQYPENWQLTQQPGGSEQAAEIFLDTPSGAFWMLHCHPPGTDIDSSIKNVVHSLDEQYDSLEVTPIEEQIAGHPATGFSAYFYCLDFLVSAKILAIETRDFTFLLLYQGESREFDQQNLVFNAVTTSLLNESSRSETQANIVAETSAPSDEQC